MNKHQALEKISQEISNCLICKKDKIGIAVPGEGNPDARIVFIGEAPGKQEAVTGRPFIGRSGKLLRKLITDAGLLEENVYITSPVKYLPAHGTPTPAEISHGRIHLQKQLAVIDPEVIVLLGSVAAQGVLQEKIPIAKDHGKIIEKDGKKYLVTYHPAAALRFAKIKPFLLQDFAKLSTV